MIAPARKYDEVDFHQQFDDLLQRERDGRVTKPVTMGTVQCLAEQGGMPRCVG